MESMSTEIKGFLNFIYDSYKNMKAHEISLLYEGEITHQITKTFLNLTEGNLDKLNIPTPIQKKLFHVMVESLQNITKHADDLEDGLSGKGLLAIVKCNNNFMITTGNIIRTNKADKLNKKLNHINTLDKAELREFYLKQLNEGQFSEKGGAGLGFIDIARKTGEKLDFCFIPINEQYAFFILRMKITV